MKTTTKKTKSEMIVFIKLVGCVMIVNDEEERGREETEGHQYLSFSSFKENIKEVLATPQPFTCM